MKITSESFGTFQERPSGTKLPVVLYTLQSKNGITIKVLSYGAGICDVVMPDKYGNMDHVVLGFDSLDEYLQWSYIGSSIGRCTNRISKGKFPLNGEAYTLSVNNNGNHLHGGERGWDKYVWESSVVNDKVVLSHISPDGDEGYPGTVMSQVSYCLLDDGCLCVDYQAMSTRPTPINLTNHSFFNLAGHGSGQKGLFEHMLKLNAEFYLPVTSDAIPTGNICSVKDTPFDVMSERQLKDVLAGLPGRELDHCFVVSNCSRGTLQLAAAVRHPPTGRMLEVFTSEPGLQVYTGGFLPRSPEVMVGREGRSYTYQGGFCAEPQNFPNAVNQGVSCTNAHLRLVCNIWI